jgi:hypothetical protein
MRLGRLIDRCAGHVNRSDNLLALRRGSKNTPNTVSLENRAGDRSTDRSD